MNRKMLDELYRQLYAAQYRAKKYGSLPVSEFKENGGERDRAIVNVVLQETLEHAKVIDSLITTYVGTLRVKK